MIALLFLSGLVLGFCVGWGLRSRGAPEGFAVMFQDLDRAASCYRPGEGRIVRLTANRGVEPLTDHQVNEAGARFLERLRSKNRLGRIPELRTSGQCAARRGAKQCRNLPLMGSSFCAECQRDHAS